MVLLERFPLRRRLSDVVKNCFGIDSCFEYAFGASNLLLQMCQIPFQRFSIRLYTKAY